MEGEKRLLNPGLWLECAGPLITLPSAGSHVVYFPQGHSEQLAASAQEADLQIPNHPNLPSQLICKLHNITLHADQETDQVFAQMTLQPVNEIEKDVFAAPNSGNQMKRAAVSFSKTLTASDTSTHGGFSIPRRAAEKVFPPLDFNKQPPAQEVLAKDLHNNEWHFRHIFRGQPKRHLLTTGWSVFVSAKRLQAGDTVIFIRDETGQLLLGIRRANRLHPPLQSALLSSDSMLIGVLAAAAHAAVTNSRFTIFYNPRASPSEFVIPLAKYNHAMLHNQVSVGMRFRMELETEDSSTRRYMGTITGINDLDPMRWPNSSWRSLKVGWDESTAGQRQRRVSLWEIEPVSAPFLVCHPSLLMRPKRARPLHGSDFFDFSGEEEFEGVFKKNPSWDRGDGYRMEVQSSKPSTLTPDHWMRIKQRSEVTSANQADYNRAMAAASLQEFRSTDASIPVLQHPIPPILQLHKMELGKHLLPFMTSAQQQSIISQHQKQISLLPQQQQQQHILQLPDMQVEFAQYCPSGSQAFLSLPASSNVSSAALGPTMNTTSSTSTGINVIQSPGSKINVGVTLPGQNAQDSSILRPIQSLNKNTVPERIGLLSGTEIGAQNLQPSHVWNSSAGGTFHSDAQSIVSSEFRDMDLVHTLPATFGLPRIEALEDVNGGSSALQQAGALFQDSPQELESLSSEARNRFLFGVNIKNSVDLANTTCWSGALVTKQKEPQNGFLSGTPFSSSCSNSGSDMQVSSGALRSGSIDENGYLQQSPNWSQMQSTSVRTFTKVYKLGSVGRSVDLTRFKSYEELKRELAQMFSLQGQLENPCRSGWQVVFVDNENDVLLLGDDPWEEFVCCVRFIKILSPAEVLQMNQEGMEFLNVLPFQNQTSSTSGECTILQDTRNQCFANLSPS